MRHTIAGLAALFLGAGLLLLGHGLLTTLLAVRGDLEGFDAALIGGIGAAYYLGFFSGCLFLPAVIRRVGHIRIFSAAAALIAAASLLHGLLPDAVAWLPVRFVTGVAQNAPVVGGGRVGCHTAPPPTARRGRVIGLYMVVNLGAAMVAQQGLRLAAPEGLDLFAIAAILICAGVLPVALTRSEQPPTPPRVRLLVASLFRLSPMGATGAILSGLIVSPFWVLGAVYAQRQGFDLATTTVFLSTVILGGIVMQWPLGWISDRIDRRSVLVGVFALVAVVSALMAAKQWLPMALPLPAVLALAAAFGGTAFCINAVSVAHVNDMMTGGDRIGVSAGLLLLFGAGAIAGPLVAGFVMGWLGPGGMFVQTATVATFGMLFALFRRRARAAPPAAQKERFVASPRTTPAVIPLDPRVPADEAGFADASRPPPDDTGT
jgi:MFS family permease